ncbi:ATP-binding cassette domain-containing protein [Umboniibacter marinipuniceus]|uniref:Sodium transport system ATP-binding protein n=1 Tax=Umboniibacter marinipuniceus TaxID=569599 RepID=A0A3M0A2J8_9GAMM|nr:ATP-binding cassette domain-containing protein [Umboniibacter marinipuniceus]RMA79411.1 sodium transport system ATP-binding protein [Umboniibacter marinipuniceus]
MINYQEVTKSFAKTRVLKGTTFNVAEGESVALLGANGAGKTTALRILCGLIDRDGGSVSIDGYDPAVNPIEARRLIGVVGDREGLYERLSVREYLNYFGGLHGLNRSACASAIDRVVEMLRLEALLDRKTAGFSQGERMKVSLARALLHAPKLLVLDEPTRGLDVPSVRLLRDVLNRYREAGGALLFSSHVMQEVDALADRILIMADGTIVANGTTSELIEQAKVTGLEDAFVRLAGMEDLA